MERLRKMQTLSHLRRKSPNALSISYLIFIGVAVIYEMLSTAFIYMPPLMGVFFTYIIIKKKEAGRLFSGLSTPWFIAFGFLIFAEQIHGFFFLSSVLVYILFYNIFYEWIVVNFKGKFFAFLCFNFAAYAGIWGISNFIYNLLDYALLRYSYEYLYFIGIETIISYFAFRKAHL